MQTHKGNRRFVIVVPWLKIAFKFPMIRIFSAITVLKRIFSDGCWEKVFLSRKVRGGVFDLLFSGFVCNWDEFCFFLRTRHPFTQPTYFSFFGLLNIQHAGEELGKTVEENLCMQIHSFGLERYAKDAHHRELTSNYCLYKGGLRIFDYGEKDTQEWIISHGRKIAEGFDPNYQYHFE